MHIRNQIFQTEIKIFAACYTRIYFPLSLMLKDYFMPWFQDQQIKGSCGQDLMCTRGSSVHVYRVVTEVKTGLVKIHYFL